MTNFVVYLPNTPYCKDVMMYKHLPPYCETDKQRQLIQLLIEGKSQRAAIKAGIYNDTGTLGRALRAIRTRAANKGIHPVAGMTVPLPDGQFLERVTMHGKTIGDDGTVITEYWAKGAADKQQQMQMMQDAIITTMESYNGLSKVTPAPKHIDKNLLVVYPFGDPHIGMYSFAKETGANFDCDIARKVMVGAVDRLVNAAPAAETALVLSVGDTFHADTSDNKSLNSGHSFDVDTRWSNVLEIGLEIMVQCIERALTKHKNVIFRAMPGNHDKHSGKFLNIALKMFYSNNPRVTVDASPAYYWYYSFGSVLLGSTHGDMCKPEALGLIMADDEPEKWGNSLHRHWLTGHVHNYKHADYRGYSFESLRTLAGRDAWHAEKGYKAVRDMCAIVYDKRDGEIERYRANISRALRKQVTA